MPEAPLSSPIAEIHPHRIDRGANLDGIHLCATSNSSLRSKASPEIDDLIRDVGLENSPVEAL